MKYWEPDAIAKKAGCVVQTIYRQIHEEPSQFPNARRVGRRKWLIPHDDVLAYFGFDPSEEDMEIVKVR